MNRSWLLPFLAAVSLSFFSSLALATHAVDHRFTVYGGVYDSDGNPLSDTRVVIRDSIGVLIGDAKTDRYGFYSILLHLHNDDLGDKLSVEATGEKRGL